MNGKSKCANIQSQVASKCSVCTVQRCSKTLTDFVNHEDPWSFVRWRKRGGDAHRLQFVIKTSEMCKILLCQKYSTFLFSQWKKVQSINFITFLQKIKAIKRNCNFYSIPLSIELEQTAITISQSDRYGVIHFVSQWLTWQKSMEKSTVSIALSL